MNPELRETIGKAAYAVLEVELPDIHPKKWEQLPEEKREINRKVAEAAVEAYNQQINAKGYIRISGLGC